MSELNKEYAVARSEAGLNDAMALYAQGDDSAFRDVHAATSGRLLALFRRYGCNTADRRDLTQETYLRLHRVRETYRPELPAFPWIASIARSAFLDRCRSSASGERKLKGFATLSVAESAQDQPESVAIAAELEGRLEAALRELSEPSRVAFVMFKVQGKSLGETAEALGVTKSAAKFRVLRATESLRRGMQLGAPHHAA